MGVDRAVEIEREGRVVVVRITHPAPTDGLTPSVIAELADAFESFQGDSDADVAILTGKGESFCLGCHETALQDQKALATLGAVMSFLSEGKPVIAAVNGPAVDEGFELALACDLIIAAEAAEFRYVFAGAAHPNRDRAVRRFRMEVATKQVLATLLAKKTFTAADGVILGFVTEMVSDANLAAAAQETAKRFLERPIDELCAAKAAVRKAGFLWPA